MPANFICDILRVFGLVLLVRIVLSYFPLKPDSPLGNIRSLFTRITEPVVAPLRRILPPIGGFDLSPLLVGFAAQLLCQAIS